MKKVCFITGTRAEYGILAPIMREIEKSDNAILQIIATNMHLSPLFGMTVNEIENDGFIVDVKIDSFVEGNSPTATVKSMGKVQEGLSEALALLQPDLIVLLGDRYEALAAASAAVVFNIPIVHLHGGETTEGAIDDAFRNAITKLSSYHFAATPQYAEKIVSMGENPDNVFHSGAPGADSIYLEDAEASKDFFEKTGLQINEPFINLAFHPVTKLPDKGLEELNITLSALEPFIREGYKVLVTMPNSDPGNNDIRETILKWADSQNEVQTSVVTVDSLGARLFHYAMDHAMVMVGNSSAALIEAPSHRLPAVNVGIRQKGRAHGISVIDVPADKNRIIAAVSAALSLEMKAVLMGMSVAAINPYFKENSVKFIAEKILKFDT